MGKCQLEIKVPSKAAVQLLQKTGEVLKCENRKSGYFVVRDPGKGGMEHGMG